MTITREQFLRAFNGLNDYYERRNALGKAAEKLGFSDFDLGTDPLVRDFKQLLEVVCRDREDADGTVWPDGEGISTIEAALFSPSNFEDEQGRKLNFQNPEAIWAYWDETKTGPFRPQRAGSHSPHGTACFECSADLVGPFCPECNPDIKAAIGAPGVPIA